MTMKEGTKELDQIAEDAIQDLREAINNYVRVFSKRTGDSDIFLVH